MSEGSSFTARPLTLWERLMRTLWLVSLLLPFAARVQLHHPGWLGLLFLLLTGLAWPVFQVAASRGQVLWLGFIGSVILLAESWRQGGTLTALAIALYVAMTLLTLGSLEWPESARQPGTPARGGRWTASLTAALLTGALVFGPMAAAVAAAASLGVSLPGAASWSLFPGARNPGGILGITPGPAPAANAQSLDQVSMARSWQLPDTAVMTITGAPSPAYWSMATYDDFDGRNWISSGAPAVAPAADSATLLPPELTGAPTTQWNVTVRRLAKDTNGPLIYTGTPEAVTVAGAAAAVRVQPELRALWAPGAAAYTLRLAVPQMDPALLQAASFSATPPALTRDLAVPPDTSPEVAALARSAAGDATGPWQAAQRVADYLRTHAKYTTQFAVPDGSVVNGFLLATKSGYCDQFSTSFIVMMRELGIPARWVMGYRVTGRAGQSGSSSGGAGATSAAPEYQVQARDAHSWAEVYVAPYGWVPIDPTPGGDVLGSYVTPTPAPSPAPGQPGSTSPGASTPPTPAPGISPAPAPGGITGGPSRPTARGALVALALLVLLTAALLSAVIRRRRQASPARQAQNHADHLWRAMATLASGRSKPISTTNITPRELFGLLPAESRQAVLPAVRLLEQVWYGETVLPPAEVMAAEALLRAEISRARE